MTLSRFRPLLATFLTIIAACHETQPHQGTTVTIGALDEWTGATVYLDGRVVGTMQAPEIRGGSFEALLRKVYGDSPAFHWVAINIPVDPQVVHNGPHELRVEKPGRTAAVGRFTYPVLPNEDIFFVNGDKIEIPPSGENSIPGVPHT